MTAPTHAAERAPTKADVEFARVGDVRLALDLYLPPKLADDGAPKPKLVVWVHGGAWRSGDRTEMPLGLLVDAGYAIASVDYRLTPVASFPAQAHDVKAAIRFLRAKQADLGVDASRIAIAGASAGGHLAALVGVSTDSLALEGDVGEHPDQSSAVQVIIDYYGPTNLTTILAQSTPHGLGVRIPALQLLLGGQPEEKPDLATTASPVFYVGVGDPPLLLIHGDQDPQVPINQAHELMGKYSGSSLPVELHVLHGGPHGGDGFYDAERTGVVKRFLEKHL